MKTIFADPTPRWVPFATAALIVALVWGATVWQSLAFGFATQFSAGLAIVLFVLIFLHGRLFWTDQVDRISGDGASFVALTTRWVGRGKRVAFGPGDTAGWVARPKSGKPDELSSIGFTAKTQPLELSFVSPKRVDLEALSGLAPAFFAAVRRDYPGLTSIPQ